MRIRSEALRRLCIRKNWFTNGCNEQYSKLFTLARSGAPLNELALVIYICSDNCSREEVQAELEKIATSQSCRTCEFWRTSNLEGAMCCENINSDRFMKRTCSTQKCNFWEKRYTVCPAEGGKNNEQSN